MDGFGLLLRNSQAFPMKLINWTERGWVAVLQVELLIAGALGLVALARWVFA